MKKYWVIAPQNSTKQEIFSKAWEYDLKNETIAVGWFELGNIFTFSITEEEYKKKYIEKYGKDVPVDRWGFWHFYNDISVGDIVIARKGRKKILAVGEVIKGAYFDENQGKERAGNLPGTPYNHFLDIKWEKKEIDFDTQVFPMFTIWEISEERYNSFMKGVIQEKEAEGIKTADILKEQEFALEKYLEDFIVTNLNQIFAGKLKLFEDEEGNGQQYPTEIGNIDILAQEPETKSYVVMELKKGRESDKVVGQVLRYMGWVKENIAKEGENIKGLIICQKKDEKLEYSLKAIPQCNIEVKLYKIDFKLI
ncbi:MAG: DUF1016 family protein [Proteobacteria bacterium]|nr:DUF1016 family protein [Pseudomonadota bacterium]